jgi:transposase-like protein
MSLKFNQSFKVQAVEKALNRGEGVGIENIAKELGVGFSTLQKWIRLSKDQNLEHPLPEQRQAMTIEKRPQDWNLADRLSMVICCDSLSDEDISKTCRERGLFSHHIQQWKCDFTNEKTSSSSIKKQADVKALTNENRALRKELNRKEKALAETAALLVLQKKVNVMWGSNDEGSLQ